MAKDDEINYIKRVSEIDEVSESDFSQYLLNKPFSDVRCGNYLMDIAQIMMLLPPPPAKLLDVGVGSGWTSELFAKQGYEVLGLDISPDMINLARQRPCRARFLVCDYEKGPIPKGFDVAVIYDALHHAEREAAVLQNVFDALTPTGVLVTIEPGAGHSASPESIEAMKKYGTTEKDMPFSYQSTLMRQLGFSATEQFILLSQLPIVDVSVLDGAMSQVRHGLALTYGAATGFTSVVLARKGSTDLVVPDQDVADQLLRLSIVHDTFIRSLEG